MTLSYMSELACHLPLPVLQQHLQGFGYPSLLLQQQRSKLNRRHTQLGCIII
jgi:hypothetical protein